MKNQSPLTRQWVLLRLLSARRYGATVSEMAQEVGVTERTIRRDLEVFKEVGFPLEETVGQRGRKTWRVKTTPNQPQMSFSFDEALALYLGRRFLEPLAGTVFWESAQRAFRKIRAALSSSAIAYLDRIAARIHHTVVGASDYSRKAELIDQLMVGIEDSRAVFITYQSLRATEAVTYDVYPYGLTYHRGSLYLVGWAPDHEQIRHWKVDRVEGAELTPIRFQRPEGFNLEEHFKGSFGVYEGGGDVRVKARFSAEVARYVSESTWHPSQELTPQKDGSLIAEFQLDGTREIKAWILSFGRHAEVLGPEKLRGEILEELRLLLDHYCPVAGINDASTRQQSS